MPNIHRFKKKFTHRLSYKPFLIWLLTTPTTPEICSYTTLYFVVNGLFFDINVGSLQGAVGFLITIWLQVYQGIFQWKNFLNWLRIDRIMVMSLWRFFDQPCTPWFFSRDFVARVRDKVARLSSCTLRLRRINKHGFCTTFPVSRYSFTNTIPKMMKLFHI